MKRFILSLIVLLPIHTIAQQTNAGAPPPQKSTSTKASKTKNPPRPAFRGSMVGYVDDAIVGSQIRIRFDATMLRIGRSSSMHSTPASMDPDLNRL